MISNKLIHLTLIPLFLLFISSSRGQTNITLKDAIDLAIKNNSRWLLAREKVKESGMKIRETWGKLWPDLSIDVSHTFMGADEGLNALNEGQDNFNFIKGTLNINPGVFYNTLQGARDSFIISQNDERKIRADTIVKTIELYDKYFLAIENATLMSNSLNAMEVNLNAVNSSFKSGSGLNLDLLKTGVVVANQRTKFIMARNDIRNCLAALNAHLGRNWKSPFLIDPDSIKVDPSEVAGYTNLTDNEIDQKLDDLTAEALKNRPEIMQIKFKKIAAINSAWANASLYLFPSIFVSGSYGESQSIANPGVKIAGIPQSLLNEFNPPGWNKSWNFTVGATYKFGALAPWDQTWARVDQSRSQSRQADLEMDDLVKNIRLEVQQKFFKLISAASVILSQENNIISSEEYFRIAVIQFKNGVIDNSKLLSADVERQNARTMYIQALFDFQTSKADLNRTIGKDVFKY